MSANQPVFSGQTKLPPDPYNAARYPVYPLAVSILTALALFLRVWYAGQSGIWRDEGMCIFASREPTVAALIYLLHFKESHPPLFYFALRFWSALFGGSEHAELALPVIFGTALVPTIYFVAKRVFSAPTGLIAAALTAFSPALTIYSAMVRPYSLLPLLCLLSVYGLWWGITSGARAGWGLQAIATALLLYTHNWGWLVWGAEWCVFLPCLLLLTNQERRRALICGVLAQGIVLAIYLPWLPVFLYQARHGAHPPTTIPSLFNMFLHFADLTLSVEIGTRKRMLAALLVVGSITMACVVRYRQSGAEGRSAFAKQFKRKWGIAALLFLGVPGIAVATACMLSTKSNLTFDRCLLIVAPCCLMFVAGVLAQGLISPRSFRPVNPVAALTGCALATLLLLEFHADRAEVHEKRSIAREAAQAISLRIKPTDLVVIAPEWIDSSFNYYFTPRNQQIDYPSDNREGFVSQVNIGERNGDPLAFERVVEQLRQARVRGRRVWLIEQSDAPHEIVPPYQATVPIPRTPQGVEIAYYRMNQMHEILYDLYGQPIPDAIALAAAKGPEISVFLFDAATRRD